MILAIDVYYHDDKAKTVGILFESWEDEKPLEIIEHFSFGVAQYEAGSFFKRELPCIMGLIEKVHLSVIDLIVVDGYVYLNNEGRKGLGYYVYEALDQKIPIVGVAKNYFHDNNAIAVCRGDSKKPLYVTSIGVTPEDMASKVSSMHGEYRFPTLLKLLDQQTRIEDAS